MMSSEEESKCLGLYGDKLLKKRQRQRVDAGEPRNSYSSIPNFSSRPTFLSGSPYEQLFSQQHSIGFLGQGFGSAKMLNELLGRKDPCALGALGGVGAGAVGDVDCYSGAVNSAVGVMIRRGLVDEDHMLRDILQGRKKELLALEQELQSGDHDPVNNNNNNMALANNNNDLKNGSDSSDASELVCSVSAGASGNKLVNGGDLGSGMASGMASSTAADGGARSPARLNDSDKHVNGDAAESDSDMSVHSTATTTDVKDVLADDAEDDDDKKSSGSGVDLKRKRVENIVSTMTRSSPLPQPPQGPQAVNGCKKRKLYHPQQHDAGLGVAMGMQALMMDDEDSSTIRQKHAEKSVLKSQLRTMQEKLVEMQHQYVQLCTRMEQVDTQDQDMDESAADDNNSDILEPEREPADQDQDMDPDQDEQDGDQDQDADNSLSLSDKTGKDDSSPPATPAKESSVKEAASAPTTPSSATSPVVKQMAPPKIHPHHGNPMFPPHPMQLALMQQQALANEHYHPHHPHHPQHHPTALSMYLGVSHKLFLEQQAAKAEAAEQQRQQQERSREQHHQMQQQQQQQQQQQKDFSERFAMFRSAPVDLDGLADVLKSEISSSVANLVDSIVSRYVQQRNRYKSGDSEQLNKDLLLASQLLDRKSPRTKVLPEGRTNGPRMNGAPFSASMPTQSAACPTPGSSGAAGNGDLMPPHVRPSPNAMMFPTPKLPNAAAAALYSMSGLGQGLGQGLPHVFDDRHREGVPEQNEALSLVVTAKKKRHKVTDTRITPRTVSRILAQEGVGPLGPMQSPLDGAVTPQPQHPPPAGSPRTPTGTPQPQQQQQAAGPHQQQQPPQSGMQHRGMPAGVPPHGALGSHGSLGADSPPPPGQRPYHPHAAVPPMLPVSLPTSVAIPNPGLHESQVFSPYSPFYSHVPHMSASPPLALRDSPPPLPPLLHPALMAATHGHHGGSPDYGVLRGASGLDSLDRSDCNSGDGPYDGLSQSMSFSYRMKHEDPSSLSGPHSSTLTPMHLRKAKLMFFWVRYPSSAVLKMYFPDIKFNKNNTAQLVKWFSNFREFYYIQMEKYARQAVSEGIKQLEDLRVLGDSEIYRVLNLHYNRNNHIEVPQNFRYVVEQTLKEFYKAIQGGKDTEPSWKKAIYKVISRMDDPVPEYFKSPNFLEQLE